MSAGSSEDRRRRLADLVDELEEGECTPGYRSSSDTEDYYNRDAVSSSGESDATICDHDATASSAAASHNRKAGNAGASSVDQANNRSGGATARSVLADLYGSGGAYPLSANHYGSARPSVAASSRYGRATASSSAAVAPLMACRICGKKFASEKAVCGHMKVHSLEAMDGGKDHGSPKNKKVKKRNAEVVGGWGVTGKRACSGLLRTSTDNSPNAEPDHSMDTVPAAPKLVVYAPTPLACAMPENLSPVSKESARTNLSGESSSKKPVHNDGTDPIPATAPVVHQAAARPPARRRQNPEGHTCAECGMWFQMHQALGGHVAAHKNRRLAAAGMHQDGAVQGRGGGSKPEKQHICNVCGAVFDEGVQLGGHMRKHWKGEPIVPKKKQGQVQPPPPLPADDTAGPAPALHLSADDVLHVAGLAIVLPIKGESQSLEPAVYAQPAPAAAAAVEGNPKSSPGPRVTGRVILFGVDIGLAVQTPPAQEGSPATKESSVSTGEQK